MLHFVGKVLTGALATKEYVHRNHPRLAQTIQPMDTTTTAARYAGYLQEMNTGGMLSLQTDPTSTDTLCADATALTNANLDYLADASNYVNGEINSAEFQENFQIMTFKFMEQAEQCGITDLLIVLDAATNNLSNVVASSTNLVTQYALGYADRDSSFFLAVDDVSAAFGTDDFVTLGEGMMLLTSQAVKFEAPDAVIEVAPTSS